MKTRFADRREAGRQLAESLAHLAGRGDLVVLALPRGGVPVAAEVARSLGVPFDVLVVRKLGVPGHEELAMGALAGGGLHVLNDDVIAALGLSPPTIESVLRREAAEVDRRERLYRGERSAAEVRGRVVVLVDDGLATGATMRAGLAVLRTREPAYLLAAVPVAPPETCAELREIADEVVCVSTPERFVAVGQWYREFSQTTDDEVRQLLADTGTEAHR